MTVGSKNTSKQKLRHLLFQPSISFGKSQTRQKKERTKNHNTSARDSNAMLAIAAKAKQVREVKKKKGLVAAARGSAVVVQKISKREFF
jgi:hypothetical protein